MGIDGLAKSLTFWDLTAIGITAILGSGGFNLIGRAVNEGGSYFPLALLIIAALFWATARSYDTVFREHPTNTAESDAIETHFGSTVATVSEIGILLFNFFSIAVVLVLCASILLPKAPWIGKVGLATVFLVGMHVVSLQGIDMNKQIINVFAATLVLILSALSATGIFEGMTDAFELPFKSSPNFIGSLTLFYFILAGLDSNIKFSEEARNPDDVPSSFYSSISISTLLVAGLCYAFVHMSRYDRTHNVDDAFGEIVKHVFGGGSATVHATMIAAIAYMLVTTFTVYLSTSRFVYGLGQKKGVAWLDMTNEAKAPANALWATFGIAFIGILINHIDTLVSLSDAFLTLTMILITACAAKIRWGKGEGGIVEGSASAGFVALLFGTLTNAFKSYVAEK